MLDLYAGSGALGIEALSRGAVQVVFVERLASALEILRRNLAELELGDRSRVLRSDARSAIRQLGRRGECYDLVLMDPPYAAGEAEQAREQYARFEREYKQKIAFGRDPEPGEALRWAVQVEPFRRIEDSERMPGALRCAGLATIDVAEGVCKVGD